MAVRTALLVLTSASLLASCASGPPRMPARQIERLLTQAPGEAQPSKVVATEIAFARAAREDGQWTAFRAFMAPGAQIHLDSGVTDAARFLSGRADPAQPVDWAPRTVWMSCDAQLAISRGRFQQPDGKVGSFVTVWQRQSDDSYRWIYDNGAPDEPQPPRRETEEGDNLIVVLGDDMIQGRVADCPEAGTTLPGYTPAAGARPLPDEWSSAPDGTLRWRQVHYEGGGRYVQAIYWRDNAWESALEQPIPDVPKALRAQ